MSDSERAPSDPTLCWVMHEKDSKIIPFDGLAFWARLRSLIHERFPGHDTDKHCIQWLSANVIVADPKTFKRWSEGGRAQWGTVREVRAALNKKRPANTAELTDMDLVRGLPPYKPRGPDPGRDTSPGPRVVRTDTAQPGERDEHFDKELEALKANVEDTLRRAPTLVTALAAMGYGNLDAANPLLSVACALVDKPAMELATDLADLTTTLHRERDTVRGLLWQILPFAVNWRSLLIQVRTAEPTGALQLPLRTETVAEIVLAGVHGRWCQFARGELVPQGAAHVPFPAAAHAPFFDLHCSRLVDAVLVNLYEERNAEDPRLSGDDLWRKIKKKYPRYPDFKVAAAKELKGSRARKVTHYMLVIDADIDPVLAKGLDSSWSIAEAALAAALPGLQLVRLKGGEKELDEEYDLVRIVRDLIDRS